MAEYIRAHVAWLEEMMKMMNIEIQNIYILIMIYNNTYKLKYLYTYKDTI